jgi:UDP-glucose 4-epimerase
MSVYLITGISGYLGGRIMEALSKKPGVDKVIGVDLREPAIKPPFLEFHKMDVRDERIRDIAVKGKVDILIHLAFVLDPLFNLARMHSIDVWGTDNVLRAAAAARVKQMFVTSSTSAYGALPDNPEPLTEDSPLRAPKHYQYAYDKAMIDHRCQRFMGDHPDIRFTMVRPCIVLGPNVDNYISRTLLNTFPAYIGGQDPAVQFVHEDDVAAACMTCMDAKAHGIYNIVGEGVMKLSEIWEMKGGKLKPRNIPAWLVYPITDFMWQMKLGIAEAPSGQLDFFRWPWWACGEKIKRELGFQPRYSTKECLRIFLDTHK